MFKCVVLCGVGDMGGRHIVRGERTSIRVYICLVVSVVVCVAKYAINMLNKIVSSLLYKNKTKQHNNIGMDHL